MNGEHGDKAASEAAKRKHRQVAAKFILKEDARWRDELKPAFRMAAESVKPPIAFAYWQNRLIFDSSVLAKSYLDSVDPSTAILYVDETSLGADWRADSAVNSSRVCLHLAFVDCMQKVMHYVGWKGGYSGRWGLFLLPTALVAVTDENPYEDSIVIRNPGATEDDFRRDIDKLREAFPNTFDLSAVGVTSIVQDHPPYRLPPGTVVLADTPPFALHDTCTPDSRILFEYWLTKRGSRPMPRWKDFDFLELPRRLRQGISVVDVVPDGRACNYRLVDAMDIDLRDHDPAGTSVRNNLWGPHAQNLLGCCDSVVSLAQPVIDTAPRLAGDHLIDQTIFLPISDRGTSVDKIVIFVSTRARVASDLPHTPTSPDETPRIEPISKSSSAGRWPSPDA